MSQYAARVRNSITEIEFRDYMVRCSHEQRAPIVYCPTAVAQGVINTTRGIGNHTAAIGVEAPVVTARKPATPRRQKPSGIKVLRFGPKETWKRIKQPSSTRALVLHLMNGTRTAAEIDAITKAGSSAMEHAKWTLRDCGIGYEVDDAGHLTAIYPDGITYEMVVSPQR